MNPIETTQFGSKRTHRRAAFWCECAHIQTHRLPLHIRKVSLPAHSEPKVPSKVYITTRPAKHNTNAHIKAAKALRRKFDHRSNRRRLLRHRHRRRRRRPREERTELSIERKLPEKYKQQTSISWSIQVLLVFSLPLKQTDRSHTHIYTHVHTQVQRNKP